MPARRMPDCAPMRELRLLSVVAPMLDEEGLAAAFYAARRRGARRESRTSSSLVDDGSHGRHAASCSTELAAADPRVGVIHLSRNFGHQTALTAGLDHARGDAVVMIDADLQDPPELIPTMLEQLARRAPTSSTPCAREREGETRFKLATARWFYRLFGRLAAGRRSSRTPATSGCSTAARSTRCCAMRERIRFLRGMTVWVGFTPDRGRRTSATRATPARRSTRCARCCASRSTRSPRSRTCRCSSRRCAGFVCAGARVPRDPGRRSRLRISGHLRARRRRRSLIAVLLLGGIQLIALGMIGEYVGRIYDEVKQRPLYVVARARNLDRDDGAAALAGLERRDERLCGSR